MHGFFITGCGTDVGKTYVTASMLKSALNLGIKATAFKPVQTGCIMKQTLDKQDMITLPDLDTIAEICFKTKADREILAKNYSYAYEPACSPHLAAEIAKNNISIPEIRNDLTRLEQKNDFILIEGAGGLLVPLNKTETFLDIIIMTGYPVLIVADNRLGCINDALLTVAMLKNSGIIPAGIIMNNTTPVNTENRFIRQDNPHAITVFSGIPVIAELPYCNDTSPENQQQWENNSRKFTGFITDSIKG